MTHVAIVTGAASGIGRATAEMLAKRGVAVVVADVDETRGAEVAAGIDREGQRALFVRHDVAQRASWEAVVAASMEWGGVPDILINNAGIIRDRSILKMSDADFDSVINVNLKGAWLGAQAVFAGMKSRGWGRIVSVSSSAHRGVFGQSNYASAKAGIIGLTRTLAIEGAKHGILANAVAPYNVDTPIMAAVPEAVKQDMLSRSRVGRFAMPEEIASVIDFFASDACSFVSGQLLEVDGADLVGG